MMKIRTMILGDGTPKYCVPLIPTNLTDLVSQTETALALAPDAFEWRADHMDDLTEQSLQEGLQLLRERIGEIPLILTIRHPSEGGKRFVEESVRVDLYEKAAASGRVDMIDMELLSSETAIETLRTTLQKHGIKLILSYHDAVDGSSVTEGKQAMLDVLNRECALGADIVKLSVFARTFGDIATFSDAVHAFRNANSGHPPVIGMVSGARGMLVRIAAECFGVDMTFAAVANSGQIRIDDLRRLRTVLGLGAKE